MQRREACCIWGRLSTEATPPTTVSFFLTVPPTQPTPICTSPCALNLTGLMIPAHDRQEASAIGMRAMEDRQTSVRSVQATLFSPK